jgi:hypothetical protein
MMCGRRRGGRGVGATEEAQHRTAPTDKWTGGVEHTPPDLNDNQLYATDSSPLSDLIE